MGYLFTAAGCIAGAGTAGTVGALAGGIYGLAVEFGENYTSIDVDY